jgi:hypothetical protein
MIWLGKSFDDPDADHAEQVEDDKRGDTDLDQFTPEIRVIPTNEYPKAEPKRREYEEHPAESLLVGEANADLLHGAPYA